MEAGAATDSFLGIVEGWARGNKIDSEFCIGDGDGETPPVFNSEKSVAGTEQVKSISTLVRLLPSSLKPPLDDFKDDFCILLRLRCLPFMPNFFFMDFFVLILFLIFSASEES
eukprot:CAMPEP_0195528824 /NCGR_PEP_ID=MMETSP0794_2-20130614/31146_1 /TAXON_ID=515487 /ORGANISM="Stephanopyxis turris, Strain CCMP 815" /LENGTH=112 /DNA_ID=CAMNT_0040660019 /DNA_START=65 /DNA_END=399 /DNA_ORIENTATION=+